MRPLSPYLLAPLVLCAACAGKPADSGAAATDSGDTPCTPVAWPLDADGDGYAGDQTVEACDRPDNTADAGGDCDDSQADVHPGATETWYDGTDQDCDGASDYDADGDGFDADIAGGDDCDDTRTDVHPGAAETWYDGIDQDCDGASDFDADGDGFDTDTAGGGDDCDDSRTDINPGMEEICCDGVDNDCSGDDPDPLSGLVYVQDGDFVESGVDTQALVYGINLVPIGDTDGDGTEELAFGSVGIMDDGLADDLYMTSVLSMAPEGLHTTVVSHDPVPDYGAVAPRRGPMDINADGFADLFVQVYRYDQATDERTGELAIFYGPLPEEADPSTDADRLIEGHEISSGLGSAVVLMRSKGDVQDILAVGAYSTYSWPERESGAGAVYLLSAATATNSADAFAQIRGSGEGARVGDGLGVLDVNGDGIEDLLVHRHGNGERSGITPALGTFLGPIEGTIDFADMDGGIVDDQYQQFGNAFLVIPDLDLDGIADVWIGRAPGPSATDNGNVALYSGSALLEAGAPGESTMFTLLSDGDQPDIGLPIEAGDINGDGQLDLLASANGASFTETKQGAVYLFYGPNSGTVTVDEADLVWTSPSPDERVGSGLAVADTNGDGCDDVGIYAAGYPDGGQRGLLSVTFGVGP